MNQNDTFKYIDIIQREITYFLVLAETLNISKASEVLGIQQSGLSRALLRLEADLDQKLFQRKNNGLVLTKSGKQFLSAVKNTKISWEENLKKIMSDSENPAGLVTLGFHPSFGQKYFPRIVNLISQRFPLVEIEVHTLASDQVTRKVNEQDLDFGLVISKLKNPQLIQRKIGIDFLAAFQKSPGKTPDKILLNPEMQTSLPIIRKYHSMKKIMIKDYEIMAQTAVSGNYLAILPSSVADKYFQLKQIGAAHLKADISCISHAEKMKSISHKKIFDVIIEACLSN